MEDIEILNDAVYDDGIYILANRRHFLSKNLEYRVAHVSSVDKLYGDFGSDTPQPVKHLIKKYFSNKAVFKTEDEATQEAMRMLEDIGTTDHGIGVIYAWENKTFKQISEG